MEIKIITLNTLVNIIGDVEYLYEDIIIKKPIQLFLDTGENGLEYKFIPFLSCCDNWESGIVIKYKDILTHNPPVSLIKQEYEKVYS